MSARPLSEASEFVRGTAELEQLRADCARLDQENMGLRARLQELEDEQRWETK